MEHKGELEGLKLAFVGDGDNNVTHSLALGCAMMGMDFAGKVWSIESALSAQSKSFKCSFN